MKRVCLIATLLATMLSSAFAQSAPTVPSEIEDPSVIGINKLPARCAIMPAPSQQSAAQSSYDNSEWKQSLNGEWKFSWAKEPKYRIADFYREDVSKEDWATIPVPSTPERQGYGVPLYSNSTFPFKAKAPYVMLEPKKEYTSYVLRNPVSSYYRTFEVPAKWDDKRIILHFAGVSSAAFVWVNGEKVGYTQGSRTPAEFDITDYLRKGENSLAVETYKYSDGSYLEDQDFWRLSGIFRDVFIRAVPEVTLWDLYAQPKLELSCRKGDIALHYTTANFTTKTPRNYSIEVEMLSPDMKRVAPVQKFKLGSVEKGIAQEIVLPAFTIGTVELWDYENPNQYTACVNLKRGSKVIESYRLPVGFRELRVAGNTVLLNGHKMKMKGMNRLETSPDQGWTITPELMHTDITLMKRANINFARTAHYPDDPRWYELCNEYGMMVADEANIESHGLSYNARVLPADDPVWTAACLDRMKRMIIRDRQNPCVMMWSMGNEAGFGTAYEKIRELTHELDPELRIIQYADMNLVADLDSQTYPTVEWLEEHLEGKSLRKGHLKNSTQPDQHGLYPTGKPFLLNEYSHAMGNSLGNFIDYWNIYEANDMLIGGFVWDWVDQSLWRNPKDHSEGFAYGGDFGDYPNNSNFCSNGVLSADRRIYPQYYELKKVYQPVAMRLVNNSPLCVEFKNKHYSTDLNAYDVTYEILENGELTQQGTLEGFSLEPQISCQPNFSELITGYSKDKEVFIKFKVSLKEDCGWAKKGFVVAWEQFRITNVDAMALAAKERDAKSVNTLEANENAEGITISGNEFKAHFSAESGLLTTLTKGGKEILSTPLSFHFWRALTDNDRGWKVDRNMKTWLEASNNYSLESLAYTKEESGSYLIESSYQFPTTGATLALKQRVRGDGSVEVDFNMNIPDKAQDVPRIGMQFHINKELNNVSWYGRGPHDSYLDRITGASVGTYSATVEEFHTAYVRPQESGNKCDVRWMQFGNVNDSVKVSASRGVFYAGVSQYDEQMLMDAKHDVELTPAAATRVNIDCISMGLGGDTSWGLPVMDKYLLKGGNYSYGFIIE